MPDASESTTDNVYDTTVNYTCDEGYKFYEDNATMNSRYCDQNGIWQPVDFPDCKSKKI